jgi:hypothetical protein
MSVDFHCGVVNLASRGPRPSAGFAPKAAGAALEHRAVSTRLDTRNGEGLRDAEVARLLGNAMSQ